MYIKSVRIRNYRSFRDSGPLNFSSGINLVVGANNVGKSSLLLCLPGRFTGDPHKSIEALPRREDLVPTVSSVDFEVVLTGDEFRREVLRLGPGDRYFPWPRDVVRDNAHLQAVWDRLIGARSVPLRARMTAERGNNPNWLAEGPTTVLYETDIQENNTFPAIRIDVDAMTNELRVVTNASAPPDRDFGFALIQSSLAQVYRFDAERLRVGEHQYGGGTELQPDARNLAEVLNTLQGRNPARFQEYASLVREVLPTIAGISVRPSQQTGGNVEIVVWPVDPALQRDDLAMPVSRSGSGVGQVLAMLYVVKNSDRPRTIVIDEPGSFLHPGAARALIGILRKFPQHQYIVASHSPEIISELSDAPVTIVRWDGSKSVVEQVAKATTPAVSAALAEVGAKLSDVYGFDSVIWVEGPSDAVALKAVLEAANRMSRRTAILPVRDTGSFRKRTVDEVIAIYRTLSMGNALLPPALTFLFDRDGRTAGQVADLVRAGGGPNGKVRFLGRRMFENYLLNITAVTALYNETATSAGVAVVTENDVHQWIRGNGGQFHNAASPHVFSAGWLENVHAASLLDRLFVELSAGSLTFRKSIHTPRLAELAYQHDRDSVDQIIAIISNVLI